MRCDDEPRSVMPGQNWYELAACEGRFGESWFHSTKGAVILWRDGTHLFIPEFTCLQGDSFTPRSLFDSPSEMEDLYAAHVG